jgi:hypothetical protein
MDLEDDEVVWTGFNWLRIGSSERAFVNTVMYRQVLYNAVNLTGRATISFAIRILLHGFV